jgi:hypothetical protein
LKRYCSDDMLLFASCINTVGMAITISQNKEILELIGSTSSLLNTLIEMIDIHANANHLPSFEPTPVPTPLEDQLGGVATAEGKQPKDRRHTVCMKGLVLCAHLILDSQNNRHRLATFETCQHIASLILKFGSTSTEALKRILHLLNSLADDSPLILDIISNTQISDNLIICLKNSYNQTEIVKIVCKSIIFLCSNNHTTHQLKFGTITNIQLLLDSFVALRNVNEITMKQISLTLMGIIGQENHNLVIMNLIPVDYLSKSIQIILEDEKCSSSILVLTMTLVYNFSGNERIRLEFLKNGLDKVILKLLQFDKMKNHIDKIRKCLKRLTPRNTLTRPGSSSSTSSSTSSSVSPSAAASAAASTASGSDSNSQVMTPTPPKIIKQFSKKILRKGITHTPKLERIDSSGDNNGGSTTDDIIIPLLPSTLSIEEEHHQDIIQQEIIKQIHHEEIQMRLKQLIMRATHKKKERISLVMDTMTMIKIVPNTEDTIVLINSLKLCIQIYQPELALMTMRQINQIVKDSKMKKKNCLLAIALVETPQPMIDFLFTYASSSSTTSSTSPPPPSTLALSSSTTTPIPNSASSPDSSTLAPTLFEILSLGFILLTQLSYATGAVERYTKYGIFPLIYLSLSKYSENSQLCYAILHCGIRFTSKKSIAKIRGGVSPQGFKILLHLYQHYTNPMINSRKIKFPVLEKITKFFSNCLENVPICQDSFREAKGDEVILEFFSRNLQNTSDEDSTLFLKNLCSLIHNLIALNNRNNILLFGQEKYLKIYLQSLRMNLCHLEFYRQLMTLIETIYTASPINIALFQNQFEILNFKLFFSELLMIPEEMFARILPQSIGHVHASSVMSSSRSSSVTTEGVSTTSEDGRADGVVATGGGEGEGKVPQEVIFVTLSCLKKFLEVDLIFKSFGSIDTIQVTLQRYLKSDRYEERIVNMAQELIQQTGRRS